MYSSGEIHTILVNNAYPSILSPNTVKIGLESEDLAIFLSYLVRITLFFSACTLEIFYIIFPRANKSMWIIIPSIPAISFFIWVTLVLSVLSTLSLPARSKNLSSDFWMYSDLVSWLINIFFWIIYILSSKVNLICTTIVRWSNCKLSINNTIVM